MLSEEELAQWLQEQPFDTPITIEDETVYLKIRQGGAELGAYLLQSYTQEQLRQALMQGFSSAIDFDAGLGMGSDGESLILTQWLPDVTSWTEAAAALEKLLNQLPQWRSVLASSSAARSTNMLDRDERRLRALFAQAR